MDPSTSRNLKEILGTIEVQELGVRNITKIMSMNILKSQENQLYLQFVGISILAVLKGKSSPSKNVLAPANYRLKLTAPSRHAACKETKRKPRAARPAAQPERSAYLKGIITEKITYNVSVEDIIAWNKHQWYSQKWFKWKLLGRRLVFASWPVLIALGVNTFVKSYMTSIGLLFAGIAGSLCYLVLYPSFDEINRKFTMKQYKDDKISSVLGRHQLCIVDDGLRCTTDRSEGIVHWKGISKIETLPDRTYIFLGPNNAYVIARSSVIEGNYEEFINCVSKRLDVNA